MPHQFKSVEEYVLAQSEDRQKVLQKLRETILVHLPVGFEECISYNIPSYVVPHSIYPSGYHCNPALALPFLSFASQKNAISLYHMGIYANDALMQWFVESYPLHAKGKPDIGKSCIRFKKFNEIPFQLIAELCKKMTPQEWILLYELKFRGDKN
jgi:Domain of unknown function (DU1801).